MKVRLLEVAEIELDEAVRWYGEQAPGLGDAFLIEVLATADRITGFPEAWHRLGVEPQQVIRGQAESADGWHGSDAAMGTMPVVAMDPIGQLSSTLF